MADGSHHSDSDVSPDLFQCRKCSDRDLVMIYRRLEMMEFSNAEVFKRATELAQSSYRPKEILELKERIESETRALELRTSITGEIDQVRVDEIVLMKRQLDALYSAWLAGKIG